MTCHLNPHAVYEILSDADKMDHIMLDGIDSEWTSMLHRIVEKTAVYHAYFTHHSGSFTYHFANDQSSHLESVHEHLKNPPKEHLEHLGALNIVDYHTCEPSYLCCCRKFKNYRLSALQNRPWKFETLKMDAFDGSLQKLPSNIAKSFESICITASDISDPFDDNFFGEALKSPSLKNLHIEKTSISDSIVMSLQERLQECDLETLHLDVYCSISQEFPIAEMLQRWKRQRNPCLRSARIVERYGRWRDIAQVGEESTEPHQLIIKHPFVKGLTAKVFLEGDVVRVFHHYVPVRVLVIETSIIH